MRFLTGLFWFRLKRENGVIQLYENKLITTVKQGKRIANDYRNTVGIKRLKYRYGVVDLPETMEEIHSGCRDLDTRVAKKLADFKRFEKRFFEADKNYQNCIALVQEKNTKEDNNGK